jgi:threonine dehydrogenase-like Zn-dependent dehydrogenase
VDTEIIVGDDDGGRLSLADLASQADGVDDDAGSEADEIADADEEADEGADEVLDAVSLNRMRKTELVDLASSLGKESSGTKADIIARLVA